MVRRNARGRCRVGCALIPLGTRLQPCRDRAKMDSDAPACTLARPGFAADTATRITESQVSQQSTSARSGSASRATSPRQIERQRFDALMLDLVTSDPGWSAEWYADVHRLPLHRVRASVMRLRRRGMLARAGDLVPRRGDLPRQRDTLTEEFYRWICDVGGTPGEYAASVGETVKRIDGLRWRLMVRGLVEPYGSLWTPAQVSERRRACAVEAA